MRDWHRVFRWGVGETSSTAANGDSAPEIVPFLEYKSVQIDGPFTATVKLKGRVAPGLDFQDVITPVTTPGVVAVPAHLYDCYAEVSGFSAGTVTVTLAGQNVQHT